MIPTSPSLISSPFFLLLGYCTYTLNHANRLAISKSDRKRIKIV